MLPVTSSYDLMGAFAFSEIQQTNIPVQPSFPDREKRQLDAKPLQITFLRLITIEICHTYLANTRICRKSFRLIPQHREEQL